MSSPEVTPTTDASVPLTTLNYVNLAAYILNSLVTYGIGAAGLLDRPTNSQVSGKYQTIITPTGLSFAIWGVIFVLQLIWVILQIAVKQYRNNLFVTKVGYNYFLVCLAQVGWTIAFSYEYIEVSLGMMLAILFFLFVIVSRMAGTSWGDDLKNYLLFKLPFTIHFGWILAASAVNVSVVLVKYMQSAMIQFYAGVASLVVVTLIGLSYARNLELTVPAVLIWAWVGIYLELQTPSDSIEATFSEGQIDWIQYGTIGGVVALGVAVLYMISVAIRNRPSTRKSDIVQESAYVREES
jgi:translocator protein